MQKVSVNPWSWSKPLGYDQGVLVTGAARQLICAGQTSVDAEGRPLHPGDMRAQLGLALHNLEAVLAAGGMGLANLVRLGVFATDVDAVLPHLDVLGAWLGAAGVAPPMTLLGVTRLALPPLMVELEAVAMG
jgi:enamine deaminase RidA (YjgF/YER057c/UK114 family)